MTTETHRRLHAIVQGRVQGVSFRYYTVEAATRLQITGWVRNLSDGSVEVTAEGTQQELEDLLAFLHRGPIGARVTRVQSEWQEAADQFDDFRIIY